MREFDLLIDRYYAYFDTRGNRMTYTIQLADIDVVVRNCVLCKLPNKKDWITMGTYSMSSYRTTICCYDYKHTPTSVGEYSVSDIDHIYDTLLYFIEADFDGFTLEYN